jgi:hypothetical protein
MSKTLLARRSSRRRVAALVGSLVLAVLPLGIAATGGAASAEAAPGSPVEVFVDSTSSASLADAIKSGWWGHEGGADNGTGTSTSFLDVDGSDPDLSVFSDLANIRVAFVATSADGSAEHPAVSAGQSVDQVFPWFMDAGLQTGLNGNTNPNDSVNIVSTGAEYNAWFSAGQPLQGFNNNLQLIDISAPGTPVSATPQGKSILNRWPAGTDVSLVFYESTGATSPTNGLPIVRVGDDGHAVTAYMPFATVAKPGDAVRTSAGYQVAGAYAPSIALSPVYSSTGATLTATIKKKDGSIATDATGNVEFAPVVGGVAGAPTSVAVGPDGKAELSVTSFPPGSAPKTFDVRYVPDVAAQGTYLTTSASRVTLVNPVATTTSLKVAGGATDTLTATVSPAVAGQVVFKDGAATLGSAAVSGGSAKLVRTLAAGKHVLSATFTPSAAGHVGSTTSKTVWQPKITTTLKPTKPKKGSRPKLTVTVVATGASVTGKVTLVFDPPKGRTKLITATLVGGKAVVKLPKVVKGRTRVTVMYLGNAQVLAANAVKTFKTK